MKGREAVLRILREMAREGGPRAERGSRAGDRVGGRTGGGRSGAAAGRHIRRRVRRGARGSRGVPAEAGRWIGVGLAVGAFLLGLGAALLVSGRE